jgi:hypothetical protein
MMATRNGSALYYREQIALDGLNAYLRDLNAGRQSEITLFQYIIYALLKLAVLRPQLNRFVIGRRIYQRKDITVSFVTKPKLDETTPEVLVTVALDASDSLDDVQRKVVAAIEGAGASYQEAKASLSRLLSMPRTVVRLYVWLYRVMDYFGLTEWLPQDARFPKAFYSSIFVSNLASIGLDASYHHLYELGTTSFVMTIGKVHKAPVVGRNDVIEVKRVMNLVYAIDERITDGVNLAGSLKLLKNLLEKPGSA